MAALRSAAPLASKAGRVFRIVATQNHALPNATTGVGRVDPFSRGCLIVEMLMRAGEGPKGVTVELAKMAPLF